MTRTRWTDGLRGARRLGAEQRPSHVQGYTTTRRESTAPYRQPSISDYINQAPRPSRAGGDDRLFTFAPTHLFPGSSRPPLGPSPIVRRLRPDWSARACHRLLPSASHRRQLDPFLIGAAGSVGTSSPPPPPLPPPSPSSPRARFPPRSTSEPAPAPSRSTASTEPTTLARRHGSPLRSRSMVRCPATLAGGARLSPARSFRAGRPIRPRSMARWVVRST